MADQDQQKKCMKILLGNNKLGKPGGSETYAYAMVAELVRQGHDVECVTTGSPGVVSDKINELGAHVHFRPIAGKFDLALLSHSTSIFAARDVKAFKVQTCHGIFPKLEQPVAGMDAYVSITEEVRHHLRLKGFRSTLIRNGIDCDRYKSQRPIGDKLETVLSLSQSDELNKTLVRICLNNKLRVIICNKYQKHRKWEMEELMDQADLVISLGRGCYEAMAMGRNVFILDNRSYMEASNIGDGMVTTNNIHKFLKQNCTGRYSNKQFGVEEIEQELLKYDPAEGPKLRNFALQHLNIRTQVKQYLNLVK